MVSIVLLSTLTLLQAQTPAPLDPPQQREFWNTVYAKETMKFRREASAFVQHAVEGLTPGAALDLGMGQGRNALFLASQGWRVTGVDISDVAIAEAREKAEKVGLKIATVQQGLNQFDIGEGKWNLIVLSYMQFWLARQEPAEFERLAKGLAPGGVLAVEGFASEDAPGGPQFGFQTNQLLQAFAGRLRVVEYRDAIEASDWKLGTKNRVMRLLAMR
jgi:SAM-dependent methyltransferase